MDGTMRLTAMVVFILIGSRVFSLVFQGVDGAIWIEHMLSDLPGGQIGFLIVVNLFIFFLAFFLDFFEIAFIILPLLGPVAHKLGIDLVWFGVLLCVNMQTSFMHPPFGFALFYLRGIADTLFKEKRIDRPVKSSDIYMGSIPWVVMQLILVAIVIFFPQTVTIFLDKEKVVDLDKVQLDMPADSSAEPTINMDDPFGTGKPADGASGRPGRGARDADAGTDAGTDARAGGAGRRGQHAAMTQHHGQQPTPGNGRGRHRHRKRRLPAPGAAARRGHRGRAGGLRALVHPRAAQRAMDLSRPGDLRHRGRADRLDGLVDGLQPHALPFDRRRWRDRADMALGQAGARGRRGQLQDRALAVVPGRHRAAHPAAAQGRGDHVGACGGCGVAGGVRGRVW